MVYSGSSRVEFFKTLNTLICWLLSDAEKLSAQASNAALSNAARATAANNACLHFVVRDCQDLESYPHSTPKPDAIKDLHQGLLYLALSGASPTCSIFLSPKS